MRLNIGDIIPLEQEVLVARAQIDLRLLLLLGLLNNYKITSSWRAILLLLRLLPASVPIVGLYE